MRRLTLACAAWIGFCSTLTWANPIRILVDGLYLPELLSQIESSESSIDILQFSFSTGGTIGESSNDRAPNQIIKALVAKKKSHPNIRIRLFFESDRDTAPRNLETAAYLESHGILVRAGSTHAKGFIFDEKTVLFGSTNLTSQSLRLNNETNVLVKNNALLASALLQIYNSLWDGSYKQDTLPRNVTLDTNEGDSPALEFYAGGLYKTRILSAVAALQKGDEAEFSIYYFNDTEIEQEIISAYKRGVRVRGYVHQHVSFAPKLVERNRETVVRLRNSGLNEIYFGPDSLFTHSKYLITTSKNESGKLQSQLILSTGNWNRTDIELHPQLTFEARGASVQFEIAKLRAHFMNQIAYQSPDNIEKPKLPLIRLYRGYKRPDIGLEQFDRTLVNAFVPATVKSAGGRGLVAYLPMLPPEDTLATMPAEFALVVYSDQASYDAARQSDLGTVYGPLHNEIFDPKLSGSVVPVPPPKDLSTLVAQVENSFQANKPISFDLTVREFDWQHWPHTFAILTARQPNASQQDFARDCAAYVHAGLQRALGRVVLCDKEYVAEFVVAEGSGRRKSVLDLLAAERAKSTTFQHETSSVVNFLQTEKSGKNLVRGEEQGGQNVNFDPTVDEEKLITESRCRFNFSEDGWKKRLDEVRKELGF